MNTPVRNPAPNDHEYEALWANLVTALPWLARPGGAKLRVIEVAGNGHFLEKFASAGHTALMLNADADLLDGARDRLVALGDAITGTVALARAPISELDKRWPAASFDIVLCHQVWDRSFDPRRVLDTLVGAVKPGGHLSLALPDPIIYAFEAMHEGDLIMALSLLRGEHANPPGVAQQTLARWLADLGCQIIKEESLGVSEVTMSAPGDDITKQAVYRELKAGERRTSATYVYHVIVRKPAVFPIPL